VPSRPEIKTRDAGIACKLCGNIQGNWQIHYPLFVFKSGDFEAPPWFAHEKYYCPRCHFLWADCFDHLSLAEYGKKYTENNYEHQRRPTEARMLFAPRLLATLVRLTGGRRFLDYGCGYNYPYIFELRSRGFDLWGCDISAAVPYSRHIRRLPDESYPDAWFDGLFSIDVMEHIADFDADFRKMARMLRPGGFMLHNTISLDGYWKGGEEPPDDPMTWAPWHCSVFSSRSAAVLARNVGLEFCGPMQTRSDTGLAFVFRKHGPTSVRRLNYVSVGLRLLKLWRYRIYFKRTYV
jgi:SAM-dependent methyltransferase